MWSETLSLSFAIHTQYLLFKPAAAATAWKDLKNHTGNFDFFWGPREEKKKNPGKTHLEIVKKTYSNSKKWQALSFVNAEKHLISLPGVWDLDSGSTALNC